MNPRCLVCYSELFQEARPLQRKELSSSNEWTTLKQEEEGVGDILKESGNKYYWASESTDSLVSAPAHVIFVLRNILEIPSQQLEAFLQKWAAVSPAKWIRLCDPCSGVVKQAKVLFEEFVKAERKFWRAQLQIVNRVSETSSRSGQNEGNTTKRPRKGSKRNSNPDDNECGQEITEHCRSFVTRHTYDAALYTKSTALTRKTSQHLQPRRPISTESADGVDFNNFLVETLPEQVKIEPGDEDHQVNGEKTEWCVDNPELFPFDDREDCSDDRSWELATTVNLEKEAGSSADPLSPKRRRSAKSRRVTQIVLEQKRKISKPKNKKVRRRASSLRSQEVDGKLVKCQPCDLCRVFVPLPNMLDHVRDHVGDDYLVKCPNSVGGCLFVCSQARTVNYHVVRNTLCRESIPEDQRRQYTHPQHICDICGYNPASILALRHHIDRTHENNHTKIYPCPIANCTQQFTVQQSVRLHIPIHREKSALHAFGIQACVQCEEKVKLADMEDHLRDVHEALEIVKCPQCPSLFSSQELLIDHLYAHRYEGLFCHLCSDEGQTKFSQHVMLRQHCFNVHNIGKEFRCKLCPSVFLSEFHLHQHNLRHGLGAKEGVAKSNRRPGKRDQTHLCDECDKAFKSACSLDSHKIRIHGAEPYRCKYCSETFSNVGQRSRHEQEQHEGITRPVEEFRCKMEGCGVVFKKRRHLKQHLIDAHNADNPFACELCDKSYSDQSKLTSHINAIHLGLRPWVCDTCGESFAYERILRNHVLIHTGERPYVCELCGQRFRQKEVLRRHVQAHEERGSHFKPRGSMQQIRKRVGVNQ